MPAVTRFADSARFNDHGRRLLVSMGLVEEDPLRVAAEEWLLEHKGAQTKATIAVCRALGDPYPPWMQRVAREFRSTI